MPLTPKGQKILANMKSEYGGKKAEEVFYASRNKGTIAGVEGRLKEAFRQARRSRGGKG